MRGGGIGHSFKVARLGGVCRCRFKFSLLFIVLFCSLLIYFIAQRSLIRFRFPLPESILSDGKHALLVDPSGAHFGIKFQKKSAFNNKKLVISERSKEKERAALAEEDQRRRIANQKLDEEAEYLYAKKLLEKHTQRIEEENARRSRLELEPANQENGEGEGMMEL